MCETHPKWVDYGGRGITVCDEWRDDFSRFLEDMGLRPTPGHTIERVDNDKGYSKDNCVWATRKEQAQNTRHNVYHEHNGERRTQTEWARLNGIKQCTVSQRINNGWSVEEALTKKTNYEKTPSVEYNGQSHTLFEWSQVTGISYTVLHSRFRRGWDVFRMLNTPVQEKRKRI